MLCNSLANLAPPPDVSVQLIAARPADQSVVNSSPDSNVQMHWVSESPSWGRLTIGREFSRKLNSRIAELGSDLVIQDHGLWLPSNHAVAMVCKSNRVKRIVTPRGMMSRWAMSHQRMKKSIIWQLYQKSDLSSAAGFFATSELESNEIRDLGFRQPIAIIPNGMDWPKHLNRTSMEKRNPSIRTMLFLSRIHPKKGLENLLRAWQQVAPTGWRLKIVGNDEDNYLPSLQSLAHQLGLDQNVIFAGPASDETKWDHYRDADVFALPSFSENFGIVIAEAMAMGVPVITTTQTPWAAIEKGDFGWWVSPETDAIASAVHEATSASNEHLRCMGQAAKQYVADHFQWPMIARQSVLFYQWMIDGGVRPDFVV